MRWLLLGWLLLIFSLNKTPLGETGCLSNPYFLLTGSSGIQFFDSPPFPTQSVRLPLATYPSLCSTCVTYRTLCHAIGHQPLPREVEDFPRGDKYFKHVPPPTYLIYPHQKGIRSRFCLCVKDSSRNIKLPLTGFEPAF